MDLQNVFANLRRVQPVFWHSAKSRPGFWAVTRYADTVRVYRDADTFSAARGMTLDTLRPDQDPAAGMMVEVTDPPEHRRLRRSIGAFFSVGAVSEMERQVDDLVVRLLTDVRARDEPVDFIEAVASQVPTYVAGLLLGLPAQDLDWIAAQTSRVFLADTAAQRGDADVLRQQAVQASGELLGYFSKLARSSQRQEPPGLVQRLARGTGDREGLTTGEVILNAHNLAIAGTQTTRCSLANMLHALIQFPGSFQELRNDPALVSTAVEESVRWANPVWHLTRTAIRDIVLGGQAIKAGDPVVVFPFSANRDEDVFERAHVFNIRRHPNPHIGFAAGSHGCPGSGMARLQMRTILARMAELFTDVKLAGEPRPIPSNFLRGYERLPVRFTPGFPALWDALSVTSLVTVVNMDMDRDLADVLLARADEQPDVVAYESVGIGGTVETMTHAQLAARASALARELTGCDDGPVLLAYPAGLDYVVAVFAAFLAGRPAVPAYPPGASSATHRGRLAQMVRDASPAAAFSPAPHPELSVPVILNVPGAEADGTTWQRAGHADGQAVAIVQYTSGSTAQPRGVLVRHESVAANTDAIAQRFAMTPECRGLSWLPPFHDMGLIGGLLTPMKAGIPVRILQPGDFLKAPLWWLRQITESGATVSGGPNFAFELCVRRARTPEALTGLDLSRWRVAFNGGEPVKERTLAEFAERFAPAGFRSEALLPCYGLAEATLMVSAGHWSPQRRAAGGPEAVNCGVPVAGQRVVIVQPGSLAPAQEDVEGELWITGPNVTHGYLSGEQPDLFGFLDGTRYLRTGDLGYARDGELFLTGRAKDVIVSRGVNYHAIDVETAALEEAGAPGRTAAAFAIDTDRGEVPALIVEMPGHPDESLANAIRAGVLTRTNLKLGLVALVPPRSVPRTSSGKVQRSACRAALLAGAFDGAVVSDRALLGSLVERRARDSVTTELAAMICGVVAGVCDGADCGPADSLAGLGVDSLQAAEAAAVLEDALGLTVPLEAFLVAPTPRGAAGVLVERWLTDGYLAGTVRDRMVMAGNSAGGT